MRWVEGTETLYSKDCNPSWQPTNRRIITVAEVHPKEWVAQIPHWAPQPGSPMVERQIPNIWLWRPPGLNFRRARGLWEIDTSLLKDTHKISHVPGCIAEAVIWKKLWSDQTADFRGFSERQETTGAHPRNTDTGSIQFWEVGVPCGHWCWQAPLWNLPSSLLTLGPSLAHQSFIFSHTFHKAFFINFLTLVFILYWSIVDLQ